MGKTINVGCNGLIIRDNKLLLGKRKNIAGDGTYGLPGGHLELGEKLDEALIRELKEEAGIEATEVEFNSLVDEAGDPHYLQVNFLVKKFSGEIKCMEPDKCEGWEWFDLNNLPSNIFTLHIPIIEAYKKKQIFKH